MRLLVGFDGSDGGRGALELARVVCAHTGGSAVVATVLPGEAMPIAEAELGYERTEESGPLLAEGREALSGLNAEARAYKGTSPAAVLTELAEAESFDAIVVGSPHRGAIGRVLLGSVARSLLTGAPCAVFVAPHGYAEDPHTTFGTIAVGYDGAPEAKRALRRAEELALEANSKLVLITAVSMPAYVPGPGYVPTPVPPEVEELQHDAVGAIDPRLGVETRRGDGSPGAVLVRECEQGVDLLVLGSRGYGPLTRVLLGSVSRRAAQEAPCPVLVVPRP
ncbi:MAG TPA: universal stress protein [Solirubrobacterales bacterium]|nr:universal stress protein [Solirubrobacterales bacterium]